MKSLLQSPNQPSYHSKIINRSPMTLIYTKENGFEGDATSTLWRAHVGKRAPREHRSKLGCVVVKFGLRQHCFYVEDFLSMRYTLACCFPRQRTMKACDVFRHVGLVFEPVLWYELELALNVCCLVKVFARSIPTAIDPNLYCRPTLPVWALCLFQNLQQNLILLAQSRTPSENVLLRGNRWVSEKRRITQLDYSTPLPQSKAKRNTNRIISPHGIDAEPSSKHIPH